MTSFPVLLLFLFIRQNSHRWRAELAFMVNDGKASLSRFTQGILDRGVCHQEERTSGRLVMKRLFPSQVTVRNVLRATI